MTKERTLETLIARYKEEIDEALVESEHIYRSTIDYELLDQKISQLLQSARLDGVDEKIVWDIVSARLPAYVNYKNYKSSKKAA